MVNKESIIVAHSIQSRVLNMENIIKENQGNPESEKFVNLMKKMVAGEKGKLILHSDHGRSTPQKHLQNTVNQLVSYKV